MEVLKEILLKEGFSSPNELVRDWSLITALSKIEQYQAECECFQKKYGMTLGEFEAFLRREKGKEDFEKEEDVADWEFSLKALEWWKEKVKDLQSASDS